MDHFRHDWTHSELDTLFTLPFPELMHRAQRVHRTQFDPDQIEFATLLSVKTGGCAEDCGYCAQSAQFDTGVKATKLMPVEAIVSEARRARDAGATRFCMGAAWRSPKDRDLDQLCATIASVKELGLETCATLGMLDAGQAVRLQAAGLDYYNHNIDTSPEHYAQVISTRTFQDRLDTLDHVRNAGMAVCCGGILGMGEERSDRISMLRVLANLPAHPESVPINMLMPIAGTPLADAPKIDPFELVRTIATARIIMPASVLRLSAGREAMSDELQALCFLAGANSIFVGAHLLTTKNPSRDRDDALLARLGLRPSTTKQDTNEKSASVA
jgi:biotin synthase